MPPPPQKITLRNKLHKFKNKKLIIENWHHLIIRCDLRAEICGAKNIRKAIKYFAFAFFQLATEELDSQRNLSILSFAEYWGQNIISKNKLHIDDI